MLNKKIIISGALVAALIVIVTIVLLMPDKGGSEESGTEVLTIAQNASVEPYLKRLRTYEREGRYEEAIAEGKKALKIDPRDERVYSALRATYTLSGKYSEALEISGQLLELVESKGLNICGYLITHAAILEYADRQNEAIDFLEKNRKECPETVERPVNALQEAKSKGRKHFPPLPRP